MAVEVVLADVEAVLVTEVLDEFVSGTWETTALSNCILDIFLACGSVHYNF